MKKQALILLMAVSMVLGLAGCKSSGSSSKTLNVYNWGEYISDGSEESFDTIREFESWYQETYGEKIKVNYTTYASNEDMYSKLSSGAVSYDVIIPSDYMIERMVQEDMLRPLNFENIPNYQYIGQDFRGLYYDPQDRYSVPYTYGIVGIIYNANVVDSQDAGGWELMWNPKYSGDILQYNNPRDAFGTAMYKLGLDVNSTDHAVWEQAHQALVTQKPLLDGLVMDEIFNMMESGESAIGSYYAGDYFTMRDNQAENVDLQFYYPERTNFFVDAMCVPKCAQNPELAEIFINFMLSKEAGSANAEYICYASPNSQVVSDAGYQENMGQEAMEILYPDLGNFAQQYNAFAYRNMSDDMLTYLNELWENVKIN